MTIYKNVASQKLGVYAHDVLNDTAKTGDTTNISARISKDGGASAVSNDVEPVELDATNHAGWYIFDLSQAETNADMIIFTPSSSTANIHIDDIYIDTKIPQGFRKNVAFSNFPFTMYLSSDGKTLATGKTVAVTRSIDGGAFASSTNTPATEVSGGSYEIDLSAADVNGDVIELKFTAADCITHSVFIKTVL